MAPLPTHPSFAETYRQSADPGGGFHRFVGEVFAVETVGLTSFLAPGKDGAIDLYDPTHQGVYECKFVGSDGYDAIHPRWREVEKHLTENLLPDSPKTGASQYRPWYDTAHPIRHYHFCVSARFANKAQADQLAEQIRSAFNALAGRAGLAHLRDIAVEVWSWDRFEPVLSTRTGLRLRWLGRGLPNGVQEFSRAQERQRPGFQAYLHGNDKLKYVPIDDALAPVALLATIAAAEQASAVIHGRGGAGKSRLLIEIGRAAQEAGWVVLQVQADTVAPESLATLVRECGEAPLLLLMDYVERCANWDAWMFALQDVVGEGATVRLLGTCRDSWRERLDAYQSCLLSLPAALDTTVRGMLAQRPDLLPMAERREGVPVFAAFLCLLYDTKQHAVLESLRGQMDFSRWLQQHIARLPVAQSVLPGTREFALVELLIGLPCSDATLLALEHANPVAASYRAQLHEDGWLTHDMTAPDAERWSVVHDVLVDGALCRWLGAQAQAADPHLQRWLNAARQRGSLPPMLAALQRVAREPAVQARPWHQIFDAKGGSPWVGWMDAILRTHLMDPLEALAWLDRLGAEPANNVSSRAVQAAVGDAIEQASNAAAGGVLMANGQEACLCRWADAVAAALTGIGASPLAAQTSNRVLTRSLGWRPARYAAASARWLDAHAEQEQAQFLLNTWLAVGEPSCGCERARSWGERWLKLNGLSGVASFVFSAWLGTTGDLEFVRKHISNWLAAPGNFLSPQARFVFRAWSDAGGELALEHERIQNWLAVPDNALSPEARFVFRTWLDAGGELALVHERIQNWLAVQVNTLSLEASYVFRAWLDAKGELAPVRVPMQKWLAVQVNALSPEARFAFRAWLDARGDLELVRRPIQNWMAAPGNAMSFKANYIFRGWLEAKGELALVREPIQNWLAVPENALLSEARFVFTAWLGARGELEVVRIPIQDWLAQDVNALLPDASFVFQAWLDARGELGLVREPVKDWLAVESNRLLPEASFVFKSWLSAKGPSAEIEAALRAWISVPKHAEDHRAGFIIHVYGNREGGLPGWLIEPACAWARAWRHRQDAAYALKHVVSIRNLDVETLQAALDWCRCYPNHVDALSRFSNAMKVPSVNELSDRAALFEIAVQLIDAAVAQKSDTAFTRYSLVDGLSSLVNLASLRSRNASERAAAGMLPARACVLIRLIPVVGLPKLRDSFLRVLASADWEAFVVDAIPPIVQLDQALKNGLRIWIEHCRPWAPTERHRNALDRLAARAR